jgi:predicted  nucleic acid-binding Zn-ribbon protein
LTSVSRDSSAADDIPSRQSVPSVNGPGTKSATGRSNANKEDERNLHNQIEDLLTALSELQRNHALLADQLQREREERGEDKKAVRSLLDGLRNKAGNETSAASYDGASSGDTITLVDSRGAVEQPSEEQLSSLLHVVDQRFGDDRDNRRSSVPQTKHQLRDELARAKEQLSNELSKSQQYNQRIYQLEQEVSSVSDQLRESRNHVRSLHQEKQRLEKQIHGMRVRASDSTPTTGAENGGWFSQATGIGATGASPAAPGGLRELKLGRSKSTPSQSTSPPSKRASSLMLHKAANGSRESLVPAPLTAPVSEHDALLLELVQAKTAEAIARQEAEEMKQKLESLRKAFGLAPGEVSSFIAHNKNNSVSSTTAAGQATAAASAAIGGMFGRLTGAGTADGRAAVAAIPNRPVLVSAATTPAPAATTGGFWGWKR